MWKYGAFVLLLAGPASAFDLPLDYVAEQREWAAQICENSNEKADEKAFRCGEAEALTNVLLEAGICLDQKTMKWRKGEPAEISNPACK